MASVVVTGTGGGAGQSILKSLQKGPHSVVAVDSETLATGLYAAEKGYVIPYASAPDFVERLIQICEREKCALVLPGLDAELPVLSRARAQFGDAGVTVVVSTPEVVQISDDKLATFQFLTKHGFQAPFTLDFSDTSVALPFPFILKPKTGGARSKGVFLVKTESQFARLAEIIDRDNYVIQEYIEGDEYTCGSVNFDGVCYGVITMRRVLRDGDTYKVFVENVSNISEYVRQVAETLKPFGACNFQLRLKDGKPVIFEINARHSGTTHCRALAGFNEPLMVANYLLYGEVPKFQIRPISILRYWQELVVENNAISRVIGHGFIENPDSQGL